MGVGRSRAAALRCEADIEWKFCDIARTEAAEWRRILQGADVVVNASGALQDGAGDSLDGIHDRAIGQMITALEGTGTRFIQISAAGVAESAPTEFFRSKARGDARLAASSLDWVILRPTLVIGAEAYGGTALLRAAAAFPMVCPRVFPDAPVQTVWIEDVARAVIDAAEGAIAAGTIADLTEPAVRTFAETVAMFRRWLGLPPWTAEFDVPQTILRAVGRVADALGWLGWRSPLRTNALQSLAHGVTGQPEAWVAAGGRPCRSLERTLAQCPATVQERWFARLYLLRSIAIATLALFWFLSGLIALSRPAAATAVLTENGVGEPVAAIVVVAGGLVDLTLGLAVVYRPWARPACLAMVTVALSYIAGSMVVAPGLWVDPLGPMLKVLPMIVLALMTAALLDDR